ncbi:MAG: hypothetical protein ACYDGN_17725 [Acidimicrobiales bacterium]
MVFNDGLRLREDAHKAGLAYIRDGVVLKSVTTDAKKTPERTWLSEVSAVVLQQAVADLCRLPATWDHPRFQSRKDSHQSIRFTKSSRFGIADRRKLRLTPTCQTCSVRGVVDGPEPLSVRTWACVACGGNLRPGVIQAGPREAGTIRRDAA